MSDSTDCVEIKIQEEINSNLGMNSSARNLFKEINNSPFKNIKIDFSKVIFMSRFFYSRIFISKASNYKKYCGRKCSRRC